MKHRTDTYMANEKTPLTCIKAEETLLFDIGEKPTKIDLLKLLTNTSEDFGLDYRKNITNYKNEETIGALFGNRYDKKNRYAQIGYTQTKDSIQGSFTIDNTGKKLLYNTRKSIPLYDFGKIVTYCGLITEHNPNEIIHAIVNSGYKIYTAYNRRDSRLSINKHKNGLLLVQKLEQLFQEITGKYQKEMMIIGEEITLKDIQEGKQETINPIDTNQDIENIIEQIQKNRLSVK